MRRLITIVISVLLFTSQKAQTFTGQGGSILNNGVPTPFTQNISGLPGVLNNSFGLEEICVDISHYNMNEVTLSLQSPSGVLVELVNSTSLQGSNFSSTCLRSDAPSSITKAVAPYSGVFKPTGHIGRLNNGKNGNGTWTLFVKDYTPAGAPGTLVSWSLRFSSTPSQMVNFTSSDLPIVFIYTNSQTISTNTILVDLGIVDNVIARNSIGDPRYGYLGKAQLNIRGNSSQIFEKKSFHLDLCDASGATPVNAPILGMPPESDWVLTPGYSDKTLMRNALTQQLFRDFGRYTPRTRYVEVVLNDEYWGVYTLLEKPKRNSQRLNIFKLTNVDNTYPQITGGYILQINRYDPAPKAGWYSLKPGNSVLNPPAKFFYQLEYPKPADITSQQEAYIKSVMDSFEVVMDSPNFADPNTGYRKYIDVLSFVDFFIISEISKNIDAYKLSSFLYKDNVLDGGKIHMGPVWDYDIAWHNADYGDAFNEAGFEYTQPNTDTPIPTWWTKFMSDPYFANLVYCRWHTLRRGVLSTGNINAKIDESAKLLAESQVRNFTQFPILDAYIFPNPPQQISTSYQAMVDDLKNWVVKRSAWLDQYIPGTCNDVGIQDLVSNEVKLNSYPNPFKNSFNVHYSIPGSGNVKMELLNIVGERIIEVLDQKEQSGEHAIEIDTDTLAAGTYILKMSVDNKVFYKKMIKTETQ